MSSKNIACALQGSAGVNGRCMFVSLIAHGECCRPTISCSAFPSEIEFQKKSTKTHTTCSICVLSVLPRIGVLGADLSRNIDKLLVLSIDLLSERPDLQSTGRISLC